MACCFSTTAMGDTILVVDARRRRELARIPSSSMGGRRPVHGYLTPVIGGQQFFVALNDGVSTPGQPNTDNTALFIDVTPGSPTYLKPAGEVRLGQGHHKAAFHPTLPRMAVSNINDCEEIIGVYDFANPAAIRRVASSDARRLGLDGSSEAKTCTPTASRPGVRPAPHGAATEPVSGLAVHNLNGTGQFVLVDMGAEPSSFTALATRGWGGAAIGVHPFGRWLYGPQYAPREGDRRAPGLPCQVGQIAVIDGAKASVVTEIPVLKDGPDCTRSLAGTPEAGARVGYVAVAPRGDKLFLPLGTLGPETTRSSAVAVFDLRACLRSVSDHATRRSMVAVAAMRMSVSATSVRCSKSRTRRRFLMSQPKVRSMTQRRGSGSKRGRARGRLTMDNTRLAFRFAQSTSSPAYPPSANTVSTKAQRPREARNRGLAPSRSWTLPAWT
jgi:hypothetical protein